MKKVLFGTMLLALVVVVPIPTMAQVDINISVGLPPPIVFHAPPDVIVIPDTNSVYAVPGIDADLFFWNGWWWRPWEGVWYRSRYYDRGWGYYKNVPSFYFDVDPDWRGYYKDRNWYGHQWNYQPIPNRQLQQNWKNWHNARHWERQTTWGVQGYQPRPQQQRQELRQQRQHQYQQKPEVQQHQGQRQQPQGQRQQQQPQSQERVQQPRQQQPQSQERVQQPRQQQPQSQERVQQPQRPQSERKPERGQEEKQDRK